MNHSKLYRWGLLGLLIVLFSMALLGCGNQPQDSVDPVPEENMQEPVTEAEQGKYPLTFTDGSGQEVTIPEEPKTIITTVPSNTEMIFALGGGDRLIGVSDYCNFPAEVDQIEKIGAMEMNVEKILSLQPDLIFITPYQNANAGEALEQFKSLGMSVVVIQDATSFEDVYGSMRLIAKVIDAEDKAEEIITEMKDRLAWFKDKAENITEKKKIWVEVSPAPEIYSTGKGTFMHEMLEVINAVNAVGDQEGWIKFTEEEIVQLNPDVIITTYGFYVDKPSEEVLKRAGWGEVPAVKNKQVFDVDNDTVTRPGPRLIDGVETLAKLIYPEVFKQ
ncbi:ABC transporter substrate-binding protein [Caldalkalibacillus mannanilyticus]|uniref:ABC transporter substrate-binding protein n=1 Tax=Caldalkalibacillus mannanilyticus TaxID=1418 RepID=UPI0004685734|nr:ABC transporter substrate-binding protein [Caldalkalibacillus mannanilyticus]